MRHTPWSQYRVAWFKLVPLSADLNNVVTGEAVEPLIFIEMKVLRRTAFLSARLLGEKKRATGVLRRDLDEQRTPLGKSQSPAESVFAGKQP